MSCPALAPDLRLSGARWAEAFPDSRRVADLEPGFRQRAQNFLEALHDAGATLKVLATRRPAQQAYLRHWAWAIARAGQDPRGVPPMRGIDVEWWHGDLRASRLAAQELLEGFGDGSLATAPVLSTDVTRGLSITFHAKWSGALNIQQAEGRARRLSFGPRDETHPGLTAVALGYGMARTGPAWAPLPHWKPYD